jgi:hypothetical protein
MPASTLHGDACDHLDVVRLLADSLDFQAILGE